MTACNADESLSTRRFAKFVIWGFSLSCPDVGPEWVVGGEAGDRSESHERLLNAARSAWPRALSHARAEDIPDCLWLATEVWEELLRSVLRTMRRVGDLDHVKNLESYLMGAFRHRFQRALLKERRYRQNFQLMESVEPIETISQIQDWRPVEHILRGLQVQQTVELLDPWTRRVWNYIKYGYSIKDIARHLDLTEFQVEFRYRRRLARLRQYISPRSGRPT